MNDWQVYGHDWAVDMLQKHVIHNSLCHAYLITGSAGVGRHTLATRLVQSINCEKPPAPGVPCRTCRTCQQIEAGKNIDVMVIEAEQEGGKLTVDQVREATKFLSLMPYASSHKVIIFLRFQEANDQAVNALLKTLEEAPAYAILILLADNAEQLLPTIVSRCEVIRLRPLKHEVLVQFLSANKIKAEDVNLIAHLADGRPGYALQLSSQTSDLQDFRNKKLDDLREILAGNLSRRFVYADKITKEKDKERPKDKTAFRRAMLVWLSYWRDVFLLASGAHLEIANQDRAEELKFIASKMTFSQVRGVIVELEKALVRLEKNVNATLLAEVLFMDWPQIEIPA